MTIRIFLAAAIFTGLTSCTKKSKQANPKQQTPAALNQERSYGFISKRSSAVNLVDQLYDELVEQDSTLKRLEDYIDHLQNSQADSAKGINNFKGKMGNYYSNAALEVKSIQDSVLREKIKILLTRNIERYNSRVEKNNDLLKTINNKDVSISDLHTALKITRTLPVVEKYQKQTLPATKPLDGYIKQQDKTLGLLDTLLEKH
jgi:hypothetical protein